MGKKGPFGVPVKSISRISILQGLLATQEEEIHCKQFLSVYDLIGREMEEEGAKKALVFLKQGPFKYMPVGFTHFLIRLRDCCGHLAKHGR